MGTININMKIGDLELEFETLVSRQITEIMLGIDWMQKHDVHWQFGQGVVAIQGR